jgi:hypothetical protein
MSKKRVVFANVVKGGVSKEGKKYGDFISVFKDLELKKDTTINLQSPEDRVKELEDNLSFQEEKGYDTSMTEKILESARKTVAAKKIRYILSVFQET